MKRLYEIPVVFRIINPESEMQQAIDQVTAWLENSNEFENAGQVVKIDRAKLGRRRLAYEIKGQRDGHYILIYAEVDPRHLPEFELNMRLYDPVLRYLIIRAEEETEDDNTKRKSASAAPYNGNGDDADDDDYDDDDDDYDDDDDDYDDDDD